MRTWTIRLLGDENSIPGDFRRHLGSIAANDPNPTVRSQLACTCKRLTGSQALPIVAELLMRDEDADDPLIPLLLWWAIENKAETDRDAVLRMFASSETWAKAIPHQFIIERLGPPLRVGGERAILKAVPSARHGADGFDAQLVIRGLEKGLEGRRLPAVPAPLEKPLDKLAGSRAAEPGGDSAGGSPGKFPAVDRAVLMTRRDRCPRQIG